MKNLTLLRKNRKLTQQDMADILKVSKPTYNHYETGRYEPDIKKLIQISDYFGVSIDYLLGHQVNDPTRTKEASMLQRQLCQDILALDEEDCGRVEAYIAGIKAKNQQQQRLKEKYSNEDNDWR